jgi:hypothetical protein
MSISPKLIYKSFKTYSDQLDQYYNYYEGIHPENFSSRDKRFSTFGKFVQHLQENVCKIIIDAITDRLELEGFESRGTEQEQLIIKDFWDRSKINLVSEGIFNEAVKTGNAYVLIWKNIDGELQVYPQVSKNFQVFYNDNDEIIQAIKVWDDLMAGKKYLNIYEHNIIYRYEAKLPSIKLPGSNEKILNDNEYVKNNAGEIAQQHGEYSYLKWNLRDESIVHENGLPVFHFKVHAKINNFGESVLKPVLPLQQMLNRIWAALAIAQQENLLKQRYIVGMLDIESDPITGKAITPFDRDADYLVVKGADKITVGEFGYIHNLDQLISLKNTIIREISVLSGIPSRYFQLESSTAPVSGEALRQMQFQFISLIKSIQKSFSDTLENLLSSVLVQSGVFGEAPVKIQWQDAAPTGRQERLDLAIKKLQLGWSKQEIQRELGLSSGKIKQMIQENQENQLNSGSVFDAGFMPE